MSYPYCKRELLRVSIVGVACISASNAAYAQASSATPHQPEAATMIRAVVNNTSWKADPAAVKDVVYETLVKYNPTSLAAADVLIEDASTANAKDLHVRLYEKKDYKFSSHLVTVDKASLVPIAIASGSSVSFPTRFPIRKPGVCPDSTVEVVLATPDFGENHDFSPKASVQTLINAQQAALGAGRNVVRLTGVEVPTGWKYESTPENYKAWMNCRNVKFFGSIAWADDNGNIALAGGKNLQADWLDGIDPDVLQNKIVFLNSPNTANSALWTKTLARGIGAIIFGNKDEFMAPTSDVNQMFYCFCNSTFRGSWSDDLVQYFRPVRATLDACTASSPASFVLDGRDIFIPGGRGTVPRAGGGRMAPGTDDPRADGSDVYRLDPSLPPSRFDLDPSFWEDEAARVERIRLEGRRQ